MCKQMITLLRSVNHQCLVLKNNAGEKVYIDLAPVADKLESQQRELAAAKAKLAAEREAKEKANQHYSEQYVRTCRAEQRADIAEEKAKRLIKKLTYNTPSFRDGECNEELLAINENELVSLNSCMCDRLEQAEAQCAAMQFLLDKIYDGAKLAYSHGCSCIEISFEGLKGIGLIDIGAGTIHKQYPIASTAMLARMKRMEDALREISNVTSKCLTHEEMKDQMKKIAKAALEEK